MDFSISSLYYFVYMRCVDNWNLSCTHYVHILNTSAELQGTSPLLYVKDGDDDLLPLNIT